MINVRHCRYPSQLNCQNTKILNTKFVNGVTLCKEHHCSYVSRAGWYPGLLQRRWRVRDGEVRLWDAYRVLSFLFGLTLLVSCLFMQTLLEYADPPYPPNPLLLNAHLLPDRNKFCFSESSSNDAKLNRQKRRSHQAGRRTRWPLVKATKLIHTNKIIEEKPPNKQAIVAHTIIISKLLSWVKGIKIWSWWERNLEERLNRRSGAGSASPEQLLDVCIGAAHIKGW